MKTNRRIKGKYTIHFIILSLLMSIVIISCGGCKGSKLVTQVDTNKKAVDSVDKIESIVHKPSQYPIVDGIVSYINDSTRLEDGVKFIGPENGKIIFPNGKEITEADYPIRRDLPNKYNKFAEDASGFYDFSKISHNQKEALLSNMDGYDPKKLYSSFV
jgi:hypothetical protein